MRVTPQETQATVEAWRAEAFGARASNMRMATRANEEMAELLRALSIRDDNPDAAQEIADVVIVLYGVAEGLGVDLWAEVDQKMAVNRGRSWRPVDGGHGYHVRDKEGDGPTLSFGNSFAVSPKEGDGPAFTEYEANGPEGLGRRG